MCHHSAGGGTGAGLGSLLLERLSVDYGKKVKISNTVFTSPKMAQSVIDPYNANMLFHGLMEHTDLCVMVDNEQLYKVCA